MNMRKTLISGIAAILVFSTASCSKSGISPELVGPDDEGPVTSVAAPSVDETLAREAGRERIIYHVGPIDLPAGATAEAMLDKPLAMRFQTDKAVWVTGFAPKVVDANGSALPPELLHQAIVFNMHEENPLCAGSPNPFVIANAMMTEVELPRGFGYPVLPSDPIEAKVVLTNPTDKDYVDVYFELTLVTKPMSDFANVRDVKPMLLELEPCSHAPMEVEPRAFVQRSATYQVQAASTLVVAHGVIESYGATVHLTANTELLPFWRAEAMRDDGNRVVSLTDNPFIDADGTAFKEGDHITFGAAYDNGSELWLKGATAAAMVYLAPND